MASSKARSRKRPASSTGSRSAAGSGSGARNSGARTVAAVPATPTSSQQRAGATAAKSRPQVQAEPEFEEPTAEASPSGPPLWLRLVSFALAILGLAVSAYETYAHYNGSHLAGCSTKAGGTFDCTAVITSPQSMVFGVIPVAILGLAFYVVAIPLFSPWAWRFRTRAIRLGRRTWRITSHDVGLLRLGSMIVGMGFVMYLIYAELYQIGQVCEYCSGVHIVTFLLFCITVVSAALWGLGERKDSAARP